MQKQLLGDRAEKLALSWLESKGYHLIELNYTRRVGEIDIIVKHRDNATIVFVEVRYRSTERYGGASHSVTKAKRNRLIATANSWLQKHASQDTHARIDVIAMRPASDDTIDSKRWENHQIDWFQNAVEE